MDIKDLIQRAEAGEDVTATLSQKSITLPTWDELEKEYDVSKHPVMNRTEYPDIPVYEERLSDTEVDVDGNPRKVKVQVDTEKVSRVTYDLNRLAVKRTVELCFGIPVRRVYRPAENNDKQKQIAKYLEAIFRRNRIDSLNIERGTKLFASCEVITLWYATEDPNNFYGFDSKLKFRCVTYSPMQGDRLYPLFDETGDLVALSIAYTRKVEEQEVSYFDTYTAEKHFRWEGAVGGERTLKINEGIAIGKIPALYICRPEAAWGKEAGLVFEMEWAVSRNGNYLRKNGRPILAAFVDEQIKFGESPGPNRAARDIVQYPKGSSLQYVTWTQAIDNLKYYVDELKRTYFSNLQLPDLSYENMKTAPMSGEARKQLFIDCQLKVKDESGRWLEMFDREVNVVKAFLKRALPEEWSKDIDALVVESVITPFTITDEKDTINNLMTKNGGKALASQRETIEEYGQSADVDKTLQQIQAENMVDAMELSM